VLDEIRAEQASGLPINSVAIMKRNKSLYVAGRRRFGCWAAALEAAIGAPEPVVEVMRSEHARGLRMTERAVISRHPELHEAAIERFGSWEAAQTAARGSATVVAAKWRLQG
jgi:hypothetical protein